MGFMFLKLKWHYFI